MSPEREELLRLAKERVDIAGETGVRPGRRGPCPFCQKGKRDTAFAHNRNGTFKCFRCEARGDALQLYCNLHGYDSRLDAARAVLGLPFDGSRDASVNPASEAEKKRRAREREARERREARSEQASHDYHGRVIAWLDDPKAWRPALLSDRVRTWLRDARGLPVDLLPDALEALRSCPRAHYAQDFETGEVFELPAMVAVIEGATGWRIGRHVTYLSLDGRAKAEVDAPRKVWGSNRGGVWLTERDPKLGPLFVAEGIETSLAMLAAWREKYGKASGRALAVISLANLQGGWRRDVFGRVEIENPRPDPERPAITWPGMGRTVIGVDHDMAPLKVKARKPKGGTEQREVTGAERARICGVMASYWWRMAGADPVDVAMPAPGLDWNDQYREERKRRAVA